MVDWVCLDPLQIPGHVKLTGSHHSWSYLVNLTLIGHAVYMSMDIPDCFLAVSQMLLHTMNYQAHLWQFTKVFNYMKKEIPKVFAFVFLMGTWT